jgi:hypothetical protein
MLVAAAIMDASCATNTTAEEEDSGCDDHDDDDDVSFASSLSSHQDLQEDSQHHLLFVRAGSRRTDDEASRRRSIFSHYWKTTGQQPMELIHEHSNISRSKSNTDLTCLEQAQPQAPQDPEEQAAVLSTVTTRRSIFGGLSSLQDDQQQPQVLATTRSLPEICHSPSPLFSTRKAQSVPCLRSTGPPKRLPSCLRPPGRFRSNSTSSCSSSVSFDAEIQVITYETPLEQYTDGSWTKMFTGF